MRLVAGLVRAGRRLCVLHAVRRAAGQDEGGEDIGGELGGRAAGSLRLPEKIGRLPVLTQPVEDLRRQLHLADFGRRNSCRHEQGERLLLAVQLVEAIGALEAHDVGERRR